MKIQNLTLIVLAALAAGGLAAAAAGTETNAPSTNAPAASTNADQSAASAAQAPPATNAPAIAGSSEAAEMPPTNALRMNFHDAPLNTVLNYLSKRMGFAISSDVEVRGNATIVSEQPVGTNEVLELLSSALAKNNYAVSRNGRILTITAMDNAKTGPLTPVNHPQSPDDIPMNDQMATDVLPVHTLNPTQLTKDLAELVPAGATLSANESGNALIMTARQKDIHRFAEILAALDSSSVSEVEVFVLKFADAKSVASELKEVFQSPDSTVVRAGQRFRGGGFGGGGFPGFGGGGGGNNNDNSDKNAANKAVFTSDDQMNAVIASAPPDYFPMISNVVDRLDQPSTDITMMRVFHLKYADPQEMADELSNLFPDDSNNNNQNNRTMGMRFLPPWMQPQTPANTKSERMTREALVRVVPDPRTASVIVTTSRDQMEQIAGVIETLDKDPAMMQHVIAVKLNNADPVTVQAAMTALFSGQNTKAPTTTQNASPLATREQNNAQQQTSSSSSTSGFGSSAGGGTTGLH
jgi:type II secretory pathway component GspD/PulD (secretin)